MAEDEVTTPEWAESIDDADLKGAVSKFESQDALLAAVGYEAPKAPDAPGWRDDLPDDLKQTAERFTSADEAIRAIVAFQKREGQVRVPGKGATDEERAAYHKELGIPDSVEGYEFPALADGDMTDDIKASRQAWAERFLSLDIPKDTATALMEAVGEVNAAHMTAQVEADKAFAKSQADALQTEWKDDFDKNKTLANRAFADIANRAGLKLDDLTKIETKDGRFLMDRVEMLKVFATIGREMAEGTLGPALTDSERETGEDQVRDLRKQINEAQENKDSKRADQLYQKLLGLRAKIDGDQSLVGAAGRTA